jgi:hypothetical protein
MNKLALLAAAVFALVSRQPANADTLFDFTAGGIGSGASIGLMVSGSGTFTSGGDFMSVSSASGQIDGSLITGVTPGSVIGIYIDRYNVTFITTTGSAMFSNFLTEVGNLLFLIAKVWRQRLALGVY